MSGSVDPERRHDAWFPTYFPATAVRAVGLRPGEHIRIEPHLVMGHRTPLSVEDAVVVGIDTRTHAPELVAVDWAAGGCWGRTMFPRRSDVPRRVT